MSLAHGEEQIERTVAAAAGAFAALGRAMSALERLRSLVAAEGEPIAGALVDVVAAALGQRRPTPAALAAAGPRAGAARAEYELLIEAIYEGYLLHYGTSRVVSARRSRPRAARGRPPLRARPRAVGRARATSTPCASSPM